MSRIDELKKQHKHLALSDIDMLKLLCPSKYVELYINLNKNNYKFITKNERGFTISQLMTLPTVDPNYLETLETPILEKLFCFFIYGFNINHPSNFKIFFKFIELNEQNLIENKDVTSYKTWEDLTKAIDLAEIKLMSKELEKNIIKIYEDEEWLMLKPLSLFASKKYGSGTKWCTTMDSGNYFMKYSGNGILIYNINKKTGLKFAVFKNLNPTEKDEFSFWNEEDKRFEPLENENISFHILGILREEVNKNKVTNLSLFPDPQPQNVSSFHAVTGSISVSGAIGITGTANNNAIYISPGVYHGNDLTVALATAPTFINDVNPTARDNEMIDRHRKLRAQLTPELASFTTEDLSLTPEQIARMQELADIRTHSHRVIANNSPFAPPELYTRGIIEDESENSTDETSR
jgi:hypothetical protein